MKIKRNVLYGLVQYSRFAGRSSRSEYRDFRLFAFFPIFGLSCLIFAESTEVFQINAALQPVVAWIFILWWIALILPAMAATARRFHDLGLSGWWTVVPSGLVCWAVLNFYGYAWVATPEGLLQAGLAGAAYLFVIFFLMFKKGKADDNRFGPNPFTINLDPPTFNWPDTD